MFKVPEQYRVTKGPLKSSSKFGNSGAFAIPVGVISHRNLYIIASDQAGWEHVSVHADDGKARTPTWAEMCGVKELFWGDDDVVMQLHPKKSEYVNFHPNTLHLWRPTTGEIPTPPSILVGPQTATI